jgi:hypothetical protein
LAAASARGAIADNRAARRPAPCRPRGDNTPMTTTDTPALPAASAINDTLRLYRLFKQGSRLSLKVDSYFQVYERLLARYVGQPIVFVEVGVLHGGSLFMWREYFGPQARIIGVDFNPGARQWEAHGFEIHIGDQSSEAFWAEFYRRVGPVDVLLDDGGHTNRQQIVTAAMAFEQVRDGGLVIVEDTHASYLREFANPSSRSFMAFAKSVVDAVNSRFTRLRRSARPYWRRVHAVSFYESIVVFEIDARRCWPGTVVDNGGAANGAVDFRHRGTWIDRIDQATPWLSRIVLVKSVKKRVLRALRWAATRIGDARLARYFG